MSLKKIVIIFVAFFSLSSSFSQTNIYLDENLGLIDKATYNKKCDSFLFNCQTIKNDSMTGYLVFENYKFGKLNTEDYQQVLGVLKRDSEILELDNKTLIITYRDNLLNHLHYRQMHPNHQITKDNYHIKAKEYISDQKKCIEKATSNNRVRLYFYRSFAGYFYDTETFNWKQMSQLLNKLFFYNNQDSMLILKPNGHYFYFTEINQKFILELLDTNDWTPYIEALENAKTKNTKTPKGLLKNLRINSLNSSKKNNKYKCYFYGNI